MLIVLALTVAACASGQRTLTQVDQQLEGGDTSAGENQASDGEGSDQGAEGEDGGEGEGSGGEDFGLVQLTCPKGPVPVKLEVAHNFNYSPNRETEVYSVNATTKPGSWCLLTIAGSNVTAEPCNFSYHYEGFLRGEELVCQIAGDGRAALEVTGQCKNGQVKLTLSEHSDDEGFSGKMNCPGAPAVDYALAYPLSQTIATFAIQQGGYTVTEREDPDHTGQFSYFKSWKLVFTPDVVGP
jgi:hypothetical protein